MQTVYVPVSEDEQFDGSYTSNDGQSLCRLKETEAILFSKEDADRVINAIQGLMYEFKEQNFKIVENGISSEYKSCQQAIDILNKAK